jgi:signal transduction histidine kinase
MEFPLLGADGAFRPFLTRVTPVRDAEGNVFRWVGTNTDVSEQRAAVADRERLLEAERELRAAAEEANRAKSQFLATMSHELRTPLNAIAGYADLLDAGVAGTVNEEQRQYLRRIARNQQLLLGLINDILNYARLEAGRLRYDLQPVLAARLAEDIEAIVEVQLDGTDIEWHSTVDPSLFVYADAERVLQILINLCSNAIKAMPEGGRLELDSRTDGDNAVFEVRDTGIGIPGGRLGTIFEPFVQLDRDLTSSKDGTGLGLAISRELAHAMNGSLTVTSEVGRGSTFVVTLPRAMQRRTQGSL